jgi:hypothetical protein
MPRRVMIAYRTAGFGDEVTASIALILWWSVTGAGGVRRSGAGDLGHQ